MNHGLRVCPICQFSPTWYIARRTSERRGVHCAFLVGCAHVETVGGKFERRTIFEASEAAAAVALWNEETERIFAASAERWTPIERARFRAKLGWWAAEDKTLNQARAALLAAINKFSPGTPLGTQQKT